jgi:hypothetical protein
MVGTDALEETFAGSYSVSPILAPIGIVSRVYPRYQQGGLFTEDLIRYVSGDARNNIYMFGTQRLYSVQLYSWDTASRSWDMRNFGGIIPVEQEGLVLFNRGAGTDLNNIRVVFNGVQLRDNPNILFRRIFTTGNTNFYQFVGDPNTAFQSGDIIRVRTDDLLNIPSVSPSTSARRTYDFGIWERFRFLHGVESVLELILTFALILLPRIFLFQLMLLCALSFIAKFPIVVLFCDKVFDPYKVLSFNKLTVHTIKPGALWVSCFIGIVGISLIQRGLGFDILSWIADIVFRLLT